MIETRLRTSCLALPILASVLWAWFRVLSSIGSILQTNIVDLPLLSASNSNSIAVLFLFIVVLSFNINIIVHERFFYTITISDVNWRMICVVNFIRMHCCEISREYLLFRGHTAKDS